MASVGVAEDQARLLEDALGVVRQQAMLMRRCLETPGKLMDALKCGSSLVSELRTSSLGPKQYYELYMLVFDALRHLAVHLKDNHPVNHLADLYELVQYAGNMVPRLYLMVTVGTVYMSVEDAPVKEIMKDMMEMSRGVQHPVRGLFLRYYLIGQARAHLPTGDGDGPAGNLLDSINFIQTNFVEMNKLWVRLQHQGHSREREQRLKERRELQLLVGNNLVRLSELVDLDRYRDVLPPLLEQIVQCRDVLAQEYLFEVLTQVFPHDYHLNTLDLILSSVARLDPHVDVKSIVIGLMDRLSAYAAKDNVERSVEERSKAEVEAARKLVEGLAVSKLEPASHASSQPNGESAERREESAESAESAPIADSIPSETTARPIASTSTSTTAVSESAAEDTETAKHVVPNYSKLFEIFYQQVLGLTRSQRLSLADTIALLVSLLNLAINIYPDRLDYVDQVLAFATQKTSQFAGSAELQTQAIQSNILQLISAPIDAYVSIFTAIGLPSLVPLLQLQPYMTRRAVAKVVIRSLLSSQSTVSSITDLELLLQVLKVLIKEGIQYAPSYPGSPVQRRPTETDETIEEQGWLARLVHLLYNSNNHEHFKLLRALKDAYKEGNERIKYTSPAILTSALKLVRRFKGREHFDDEWADQSKALYRFMHTLLSNLYSQVPGAAEQALRLFVACGQVADQTGFEDVSYEFFAQAFSIYEEAISDSRAQFEAVCIVASALHGTRRFGKENYDTLITKCALHGSKLLKKPHQCRAVYLASHLWWVSDSRAREKDDDGDGAGAGAEAGDNGADEQSTKPVYRDGKRVLECLQRALRVADACMDTSVSVELFVEILNRYVYYFEQENETVTTKYLNGLIELIHSNLQTNDASPALESAKAHFQRTLDYIASREYDGVVIEPN